MSKTSLKKAIAGFTREELLELLLEVYDARKQAKEYLDYYADPDLQRLTEKYKAVVAKELGRSHRGRPTPRITRIKRALADYLSFAPGAEAEADMRFYIIKRATLIPSPDSLKETTVKGLARLLSDSLTMIDRAALTPLYLPGFIEAINQMRPKRFWSAPGLKEALQDALDSFAPGV